MTWWKWVILAVSWGALSWYTTWLYSMVLRGRQQDRLHFARVVGELRDDIQYLAECAGVDLSYKEGDAPTEEFPAVAEPEGPATVEADAVVARTLDEILAEAGREPLKRRRW